MQQIRSTYPKVKLVRCGTVSVREKPDTVRGPDEVARLARAFVGRETVEVFVAILLDNRHKPMAITEISRGTISGALVHPRETFRVAIAAGATALIVSHNHPSGDPTPSGEDLAVTERLKQAGDLLGIPLLDHVIVTDSSKFFSIRENGSSF